MEAAAAIQGLPSPILIATKIPKATAVPKTAMGLAANRDPRTIKGQLDFVAYQLLDSHEGIGRNLHKAETYEEAKEAVDPHVRL